MDTVVRGLLLMLLAHAAGCGSPSTVCRSAGQACTVSGDCCNSLVCSSGTCQTGTVRGLGQACITSTDCSSGLECRGGLCATPSTCRAAGGACAVAADCCGSLVCTGSTCSVADMRKPIGAPCTDSSQCLSSYCLIYQGYSNGACSAGCTMSTTCAALANGYWCLPNSSGPYCVPACSTSASCRALVSTWSCNNTFTVEGTVIPVCALWPPRPIGNQCFDNNQCTSQNCNGSWCTAPCANDAACGQNAWCVLNNNQAYNCFPSCTSNADCVIYGQNVTCKPTTTRDGTSTNICSG
jgi:hypothetical protein